MRKVLSYLFTVPASVLFLFAEKIRGEKVVWRYKEVVEASEFICTKCGHKGKPK